MRVAVIHKPYFFPWMGYFSKLLHAQVFIVQDNVLASNRVWINRSQIIRPDGQPGYITLPIGEKGHIRISDIELSSEARQNAARLITMSVEHAYARSRHFAEWKTLKPDFLNIMSGCSRLIDIDIAIITALLSYLQIPFPEIHVTSELQSIGNAVDTIISNCRETSCDALILGRGNDDWTKAEIHRMRQAGIALFMHDFYGMHPEYYQTRRQRLGFCRGLSILDCILNEGPARTKSLLDVVECTPYGDG
jgi:hypothetical protein